MKSNQYSPTKECTGFKQGVINIRYWLCLLFVTGSSTLYASDHVDGPITIQNPIADITDLYAFPNPNKRGNLVLIANVHLAVSRTGHFSDRIHYDFLVRPARLNSTLSPIQFQVGDEIRISCQFETATAEHAPHWVTCYSDRGNSLRTQVDATEPKMSDKGLQVFAGRRADPFFINISWAMKAAKDAALLKPENHNSLENLNVLSIVLEIDLARYFIQPPSLMAFAFETLTQDDQTLQATALRRIDWVGRPEITNISMVAHEGDEDLRDLYNQETPFNSLSPNRALYQARLRKNIDYYDALDGKQDWTAQMADHYTELLLNDYLVIDMSKPCDKATYSGYLSIETALLKGEVAQNCGGRHPNDDIMDRTFSTFIHANQSERIRDGVDQPSNQIAATFPYLAAPNESSWAAMKAWFIRILVKFFG